jgi:hypothetical protein
MNESSKKNSNQRSGATALWHDEPSQRRESFALLWLQRNLTTAWQLGESTNVS